MSVDNNNKSTPYTRSVDNNNKSRSVENNNTPLITAGAYRIILIHPYKDVSVYTRRVDNGNESTS